MQEHKLKECEYCGKIMPRKRWSNGELISWLHYNRQKYCDRECMKAAFIEKPTTITTIRAFRAEAQRLKPEGCCEICGSNKNVDVHHKDHDPSNNNADNLQRLCRSCHMKIHRSALKCKVCDNKARGLGYCDKHYQRYKKYGNPFVVKRGCKGQVVILAE